MGYYPFSFSLQQYSAIIPGSVWDPSSRQPKTKKRVVFRHLLAPLYSNGDIFTSYFRLLFASRSTPSSNHIPLASAISATSATETRPVISERGGSSMLFSLLESCLLLPFLTKVWYLFKGLASCWSSFQLAAIHYHPTSLVVSLCDSLNLFPILMLQ